MALRKPMLCRSEVIVEPGYALLIGRVFRKGQDFPKTLGFPSRVTKKETYPKEWRRLLH
jgi:hypothetical protein